MSDKRDFDKQRLKNLERRRGFESVLAEGTGSNLIDFAKRDDPYWLPEGTKIGDMYKAATEKGRRPQELVELSDQLLGEASTYYVWSKISELDLRELKRVSESVVLALKRKSVFRGRSIRMYLSPDYRLAGCLRAFLEIVNDPSKWRGCTDREKFDVLENLRHFHVLVDQELRKRRRPPKS